MHMQLHTLIHKNTPNVNKLLYYSVYFDSLLPAESTCVLFAHYGLLAHGGQQWVNVCMAAPVTPAWLGRG